MKIAFITDTYFPHITGVAVSVEQFYLNLKKQNHEITLFVPEVRGYKDTDKSIIRLSSFRLWPTLPPQVRIPFLFLNKNYSTLLNSDFDLIHAHGSGPFSALALIVAKYKKIPVVLSYHTDWASYTHYILGGNLIKKSHVNIIIQKFCNKFDAIVVPSAKIKQLLIKNGVTKLVEVIPTHINFSKFNDPPSGFIHKKLNLDQTQKIILTAGRLGKEKKFEFLIDVMRDVIKIDPNAHLVLAGDGPFKKNLEEIADNLNLSKHIHFLGAINPSDMPEVYKDSDIFAFASQTETQGLVVLEAAASSLPLVIIDDSAFEGTIKDNYNGFLVTPDKRDDFAGKLIKLLGNETLRKSMGEKSRELVIKEFDPMHLTQKLVNLYRKF